MSAIVVLTPACLMLIVGSRALIHVYFDDTVKAPCEDIVFRVLHRFMSWRGATIIRRFRHTRSGHRFEIQPWHILPTRQASSRSGPAALTPLNGEMGNRLFKSRVT